MDKTKVQNSQYWLGKMIENGSLVEKLEEIPGVRIIKGSGVPVKGNPAEHTLEKYLVEKKLIDRNHPFCSWWVSHPGKKATWDFICLAEIHGKEGIILLEAKAHRSETNKSGKKPPVPGKDKNFNQACRNHRQIEQNIQQEFERLGKDYPGGYYQTVNRIAYTSKAHAALGMPVLLVFLGFIGACFTDSWKDEPAWLKDNNAHLQALGLPGAIAGGMTELAQGGPYITALSKRCAEIPEHTERQH